MLSVEVLSRIAPKSCLLKFKRKILVYSKKYKCFLTFSCEKITETGHIVFAFCNFLTKKSGNLFIFAVVIKFSFFRLFYVLSCHLMEKDIIDFKSGNEFLNLFWTVFICSEYIFSTKSWLHFVQNAYFFCCSKLDYQLKIHWILINKY